MTDRPDTLRRLDRLLEAAMIAHGYVADRQHALAQLGRASDRSLGLLHESAHVTLTEIPRTLRRPTSLVARWEEQELLDPAGAAATLRAIESSLNTAEPEVAALLDRQRRIAIEMQLLVEQAQGR